MDTPPKPTRTASEVEALEAYNTACRALAAASHDLNEAQNRYNAALASYHAAFGAARQAKVIS